MRRKNSMEIIAYDYEIHKNKKIIIYGIGEMGYITSRCLQKLDIQVYRYANRDASYHALFGDVISTEEMLEICKKEDAIILFSITGYARKESKYLYDKGIERIYSVRKLWSVAGVQHMEWNDACQSMIDNVQRYFFTEDTITDPSKLYFYSLDAVVTERCSLKCKDCSNLMQYYQYPQNMDVNELKQTLDNLLLKDCRIFDLRILGGEPLMNKDFFKIVDWYKNEVKIDRISLFTNATIFPEDRILEHLKHEKIFISLSDYGAFSSKLKKWIQWCTENDIKYEVKKIEEWQDCGSLERHDYDEQELVGIYSGCECRNLPTIKGGYLYNCAYAANAADLGAMLSNEMNRDRLLLTNNISIDDIDEFLYERKYLEACRYCKGRNFKQAKIVPYIQTERPLKYERLLDVKTVEEVEISNHEIISVEELLSVVIPVFNMEEYIERCLTSVLNSSYQNLEIIIVDDGSRDDTIKLCRKIAEQDSFRRVRIIENKHDGVVKARNTGILAANGKYITFVDADDYIGNDRLISMVEAMDGCDLVCAGYTKRLEEKLIRDELMDRGQSKIEIMPCLIPEGVYEGEKLLAFIKSNFLSLGYWHNCVGNNLWKYTFRTDMIKKICTKIDSSVWFGEDMLLCQIYSLYCNRIHVIKNRCYYHCCRKPQNRYPVKEIMANMEKLYHCLCDELMKHPKASLFKRCLQEEYLELCIDGLRMQGIDNNASIRYIYYPYYGRLNGKKIILYGAGNVGKAYYYRMKEDSECLLVAWIDKNAEKIRELDFLPVEGIDSLYSKKYDYIVIAVFDEITYQTIRKELIESGVKKEVIIWNPTKYMW